jgi:hypothetical protein
MDEAVVFELGERQYDLAIPISMGDIGGMPGSMKWFPIHGAFVGIQNFHGLPGLVIGS